MTKSPVSLAELRQMLRPKVERQHLSFSAIQDGIAKGAVTAISGHGKTEFTLQLFRENPDLKCAWIESSFSAFPFAFFQKEISSQQVLFIESGEHCIWTCLQALRAGLFPLLVFYSELNTLSADQRRKTLRRLQLAAEKSNCAVIWLAPQEHNTEWAVHTHITVDRGPDGIQSQVLKRKF